MKKIIFLLALITSFKSALSQIRGHPIDDHDKISAENRKKIFCEGLDKQAVTQEKKIERMYGIRSHTHKSFDQLLNALILQNSLTLAGKISEDIKMNLPEKCDADLTKRHHIMKERQEFIKLSQMWSEGSDRYDCSQFILPNRDLRKLNIVISDVFYGEIIKDVIKK